MSVYRARVTRVGPSSVHVVIPDLAGSKFEFGPLPTLTGVTLNVGDTVAVGATGDVRDDVVLLAGSGGPGPALDLNGLSDVTLTSPVVGDILMFNGTHWVNKPRWPVGSCYFTADDAFDPNVEFGGTWVKIEGVYIAATGTPFNAAALTAFGADTITLIEANLPAHQHSAGTLANAAESSHTHAKGTLANAAESSHTHGVGTYANGNQSASHSHGVGTLTMDSQGSHKHTLGRDNDAAGGSGQWHLHSTGSGATENSDVNVGSNGAHTHTISGSTATQSASHSHTITGSSAAGSSHNHTISGSTAAGSSHNHAISGSTGDGAGTATAITNRPLGITLNVWRRTA